MTQSSSRSAEIERWLRRTGEAPEFTMRFEPVVNSMLRRVVGFDARLDWSDHGFTSSSASTSASPDWRFAPTEFVAVAEDCGMIVQIGARVLDESCRQVAWWRTNVASGGGLFVSVTMSTRQIVSPDIVNTVADALGRHGLSGEALHIQIDESVMAEDTMVVTANLSGLRTLGVRIVLKDFGLGSSSLSRLQYFPVSAVKINPRFVHGLGRHEADHKLVRCLVSVADAFDIDSVAEGVETREQVDSLNALGCRLVQGPRYSSAVASEDVPAVFFRLNRHALTPRRHLTPTPAGQRRNR